jgi:hypothetical protein
MLSADQTALLRTALVADPEFSATLLASPALESPHPEATACLLSTLLGSEVNREELGRVWAGLMMRLNRGRGSVFDADPTAIEELLAAMDAWPLHDGAWWRGFWAGMSLDQGAPALQLRVALYHALYTLMLQSMGVPIAAVGE